MIKVSFPVAALAMMIAVGGNAAGAADPQVTAAICRNLATYAPDPGVAYQPGVDVHGHPVAPADLPGSAQPDLGGVAIPLYGTIPGLASGTASGVASGAGSGQAAAGKFALGQGTTGQSFLGAIQLNGNQVLLNGKPLQDDSQARLAAACRAQGFTR